jgi:hypothetical protein
VIVRVAEQRRAAALAGDIYLRRRHLELAELLTAISSRAASSDDSETAAKQPAGARCDRGDRTSL